MTTTVQSSPARPVEADHAQLERIRVRLADDVQRGICDGVALRVSIGAHQIFDHRVGYADRDAARELTENSVMAQFSVSKQFGSVLALMFIERGLLRLHTTVAEVIPEFGCLGKETINLHHLLTQTSGLAPDTPTTAIPAEAWFDSSAMTNYVSGLRLQAEPGTRVSYLALIGHSVIAEMLHRVDPQQRSYVELVEQELLNPLGMQDTAMGLTRPDLIDRFAPIVPRFTETNLFAPHEIAGLNDMAKAGPMVPGGGYVTTISDLDRFTRMLANGGTSDGVRILSQASLNYAARNQTDNRPNDAMAYSLSRNWVRWPANIGTGFFVRGSDDSNGPIGNLAGPRALAGLGSGIAAFVADPDLRLSISMLNVGVMGGTDHLVRVGAITDMVIAAL